MRTIDRFRSAAAFATYTGTAPIDVSPGDVVRHRLSRAGDRQLNRCLHVMALTQIRQDTSGRSYYLRKRTDGKGHKEAMRWLKRRLSDVVYRQLRQRRKQTGGRPGRTLGGGSRVQRGQLKPRTLTLRTSHFPDPPAATLQLAITRSP